MTKKEAKVIRVAAVMKKILKIAKTVEKRRPYWDDKPNGYLESDDDYIDRNRFAAVKLLDLAQDLAKET